MKISILNNILIPVRSAPCPTGLQLQTLWMWGHLDKENDLRILKFSLLAYHHNSIEELDI